MGVASIGARSRNRCKKIESLQIEIKLAVASKQPTFKLTFATDHPTKLAGFSTATVPLLSYSFVAIASASATARPFPQPTSH